MTRTPNDAFVLRDEILAVWRGQTDRDTREVLLRWADEIAKIGREWSADRATLAYRREREFSFAPPSNVVSLAAEMLARHPR